MNDDLDDASRSVRKRRAILDAATDAFLNAGYSRTSMDDVARLAKVSKQTVYQHFGDKERLVTEVVLAIVSGAGAPVDNDVHHLGASNDLASDLKRHGRRQLRAVLQPRPMQLRRLVIAEAVTFPALGAAFYEHGPGRTIAELADAFGALQQRGLLRPGDPRRAASDFNWLLMSEPLNRAMILGDDGPPKSSNVNVWADEAVETFLAAYGTSRQAAVPLPANAQEANRDEARAAAKRPVGSTATVAPKTSRQRTAARERA